MDETTREGVTVSVVVPCKNDARYLTSNLESILSQDYPHLECIVVDGGSTDVTLDLLKQYGDRIRWISGPDRGAFDAINRGWQLAKGEILTWLNADDVWEPGAVRTAVEAFEQQPDVDVVYGTAGVVDELGRVHGDLVPREWDLEYALRNCDHIIFQPASFMRRRILERVGWLYPAWCHDHDLWLRIARAGGTFAKVPARLAMDRLRLENQGHIGAIVIPGKVGLTRRFFEEPVPPQVRKLRRRAISNAYVRSLDYLRGNRAGDWVWAAGLVTRAIVVDPRNLPAVSQRCIRPVRGRGPVFLARTRKWFAAMWRLFVRLVSFLFTRFKRLLRRTLTRVVAGPRQLTGRMLERVFMRGNRQLVRNLERVFMRGNRRLLQDLERIEGRQAKLAKTLEVFRIQQEKRMRGVQRAIPGALQPVTAQVDSLAATIQQVRAGIERERNVIRGTLDSLRHEHTAQIDALTADALRLNARFDAVESTVSKTIEPVAHQIGRVAAEHEVLRGQIAAALQRPSIVLSESGDVYGTPPTLQRIPGWRWAWGIDSEIDPFTQERRRVWASLKHPVLLQWFADLRVMIWPGNESSRVLFLTGTFEPNELTWVSQVLTNGMTFIDVGANMGIYSMFASKLVEDSGTVVAVEPSTRDFQRLAFHVTLNNLQNVRCIHVAASDDNGQASLKVASDQNSGHNTFGAFAWPGVELAGEEIVQTRRLDALVSEQRLESVDLVKIDVEGHELRVLEGAIEMLARFRPKILIEVFDKALRAQGASARQVLAFLEREAYVLYEFSETTGELVPLSSSLEEGSHNVLALPK